MLASFFWVAVPRTSYNPLKSITDLLSRTIPISTQIHPVFGCTVSVNSDLLIHNNIILTPHRCYNLLLLWVLNSVLSKKSFLLLYFTFVRCFIIDIWISYYPTSSSISSLTCLNYTSVYGCAIIFEAWFLTRLFSFSSIQHKIGSPEKREFQFKNSVFNLARRQMCGDNVLFYVTGSSALWVGFLPWFP